MNNNTLYHPNPAQRAAQRIAALGVVARISAHVVHHLDRPVFRLTGGRRTAASLLTGLPIIMLTTTGAKSGQPRTVPLVAIPGNDGLILIASNWGSQRHPAWYHNLKAHPECVVEVNGRTHPHTARELSGDEKTAAWQTAVRLYPGYAAYQKRTSRNIPVLKLLAVSS